MSKILVVEPYKILQRAIALSFFPEHQVEVTEEIPDMSAIEQRSYDVAIIDAGALREKITAGDLNRRLQGWQIPMIWLEDSTSPVAPVRDNLMVLRKPIARNDLLAALSCCQAKVSTIALTDVGEKLRNKTVLVASELKPDPEHTAQIIELVDVVEEKTTDPKRDEPLERKKQ
ncbi:MAG TPA: hypothetical protein VF089_11355 [Candidatus Binatia bacterium]